MKDKPREKPPKQEVHHTFEEKKRTGAIFDELSIQKVMMEKERST